MKILLLPILLLPLCAVGQYRPSYTPPPPRMTPTPYQVQQQQQQQAHQNFQRMQAQQMQQAQQYRQQNQQQHQQRMMQSQQQMQQQLLMARLRTQQQFALDQQQQQQAEQQANEQLAQLAQTQERRRQEHPAADAQQALAQQREDAKQLNLLTVKNYQDVFLPGLLSTTFQGMSLAPSAQQQVDAINRDVLNNAWWKQQTPAQAQQQLAAHSSALLALTKELLEYDIALPAPTPAPLATGPLNELLANDQFDPAVAAQLIRQAAAAEKIAVGTRLAQAAVYLQGLSNSAASRPELQQKPNQLRDEVKTGIRNYNKALQQYHAQIGSAGKLYEAQQAVRKSTGEYLAKNTPAPAAK